MHPEHPKFLVDSMLGRLATWLRMLGEDASLPAKPPVRTTTVEVFLTRRKSWKGKPGVVFIEHDLVADQLAQLRDDPGLILDPERLFSRCLRCNTLVQAISREQAASLVPDYTAATAPSFTQCPKCGRVYWPGSHGQRAMETLRRIFS